jgi:hypothetical protein
VARKLIDESKPEWVVEKDIYPEGDPDVQYLIRPVAQDTFRRLQEQHTTKVLNRRTHQRDVEVDGAALSDAVLDQALVDWKGIQDSSGKTVPCELAAKKQLPGLLIEAITAHALQTGGAAGRTADERKESFRATASVV